LIRRRSRIAVKSPVTPDLIGDYAFSDKALFPGEGRGPVDKQFWSSAARVPTVPPLAPDQSQVT
jgi:hypothetical protein